MKKPRSEERADAAPSVDFSGLLNAIGIILLAAGAFAGLSVHATHLGIHHADHSHVQEIAIGIILMVVGVVILVLNSRQNTTV